MYGDGHTQAPQCLVLQVPGTSEFLTDDPKPPSKAGAASSWGSSPEEGHITSVYPQYPLAQGTLKGGGLQRMDTGHGHAAEDAAILCWRLLGGQDRARAREQELGLGERKARSHIPPQPQARAEESGVLRWNLALQVRR